MVAACAETVPYMPLTASGGTWTAQWWGTASRRMTRSESGVMSSPSSEGVNIGRGRGSKSRSRPPSTPLLLKMPDTMSASPIAASISAVKISMPRQPLCRHISQRIRA